MLDARVHLPPRGFLFAAALLAATTLDAQQPPDTTKKAAAQIMSAAAMRAAATIAAQQRAAAVAQPAARQWPAPKPCVGTPTYSRGRPGAPPTVPDLAGSTLRAARSALAQSRVMVDFRFARGTGRPDSIIAQAPPAGTPVAPGDTVIVCSYLPTRIPDVTGQPVGNAQQALSDSGFRSFVISVPVPPGSATNVVIRQSPPARSVAPLGSVDTLYVGVPAPPPTRPMPPLVGLTYIQASNALQPLLAFTNNQLRITWRSASGGSYTTPGSIVVTQRPDRGTPVQAGDAILVVLRDTTSAPPPPLVVHMPDVGGGYLEALRTLARLRSSSGLPLPIVTTGDPDDSASRARLVVVAQQPLTASVITSSTTVTLTLRDTTTPPPPPPADVVRMPDLSGRYVVALRTLARLRATTGWPLRVTTTGDADVAAARSRLLVRGQSPAPDTDLSATTTVSLDLLDTTTQAAVTPTPQVTIMPDVVGRTVKSARDTLFMLGIPFRATATDRDDSAGDDWIIQSQSLAAGDTVVATTTVRLYATDPAAPFPWLPIILGVAALTAVAAATTFVRTGQQRVARVAVVPHVDPIPRRLKFSMRGGETADEAFGRLGLSIKPVADRGRPTVTRLTLASSLHRNRNG